MEDTALTARVKATAVPEVGSPRPAPRRIIIGMTGATGAVIGIRLLEELGAIEGIETHLIISKWAKQTILHETDRSIDSVRARAGVVYGAGDMSAAISSGSFLTHGMAVVPCSMRTLAAIATGQGETLIQRAADVVLKEGRKLILAPRESPLSAIHLENMLKLARLGVTILPPMPAFYSRPQSIEALVDHMVQRVLDQFSLPAALAPRWGDDGA